MKTIWQKRGADFERQVGNTLMLKAREQGWYVLGGGGKAFCGTCKRFITAPSNGADFRVFREKPLLVVEAKTGDAQLTKREKLEKAVCEATDIPFLIVRDNIDRLVEAFQQIKERE